MTMYFNHQETSFNHQETSYILEIRHHLIKLKLTKYIESASIYLCTKSQSYSSSVELTVAIGVEPEMPRRVRG
jgi:hypothetical protein